MAHSARRDPAKLHLDASGDLVILDDIAGFVVILCADAKWQEHHADGENQHVWLDGAKHESLLDDGTRNICSLSVRR